MPLTKCSECGHEMSSDAAACPNCGKPGIPRPNPTSTVYVADASPEQRSPSIAYIVLGILIGVIVLAVLIFFLRGVGKISNSTNTNAKASTTESTNQHATPSSRANAPPRDS